jgi:hypothetical protein
VFFNAAAEWEHLFVQVRLQRPVSAAPRHTLEHMFAPDHSLSAPADLATNPHRAVPRAARACRDSAALCADRAARHQLLRDRRPGRAARAPQRCLVAEANAAPQPVA